MRRSSLARRGAYERGPRASSHGLKRGSLDRGAPPEPWRWRPALVAAASRPRRPRSVVARLQRAEAVQQLGEADLAAEDDLHQPAPADADRHACGWRVPRHSLSHSTSVERRPAAKVDGAVGARPTSSMSTRDEAPRRGCGRRGAEPVIVDGTVSAWRLQPSAPAATSWCLCRHRAHTSEPRLGAAIRRAVEPSVLVVERLLDSSVRPDRRRGRTSSVPLTGARRAGRGHPDPRNGDRFSAGG